jgi:hypothetical protein
MQSYGKLPATTRKKGGKCISNPSVLIYNYLRIIIPPLFHLFWWKKEHKIAHKRVIPKNNRHNPEESTEGENTQNSRSV